MAQLSFSPPALEGQEGYPLRQPRKPKHATSIAREMTWPAPPLRVTECAVNCNNQGGPTIGISARPALSAVWTGLSGLNQNQ